MRAIRKDLATRLKLQMSQETKVRIIKVNPNTYVLACSSLSTLYFIFFYLLFICIFYCPEICTHSSPFYSLGLTIFYSVTKHSFFTMKYLLCHHKEKVSHSLDLSCKWMNELNRENSGKVQTRPMSREIHCRQ